MKRVECSYFFLVNRDSHLFGCFVLCSSVVVIFFKYFVVFCIHYLRVKKK